MEDNGPSKRPRSVKLGLRVAWSIECQELGLLTFAERLGLLSLAENVESLDEWRPIETGTTDGRHGPTADMGRRPTWADSDGDLLWQHLDRLMTRS